MLLRLTPLRRLLDLNAIWVYLAAYQAIRFVCFQYRLLFSDSGILKRPPKAEASS